MFTLVVRLFAGSMLTTSVKLAPMIPWHIRDIVAPIATVKSGMTDEPLATQTERF
jgi:hypothetical protein